MSHDRFASIGVADSALFLDINVTCEDSFQFFLHVHDIEKIPACICFKAHQNISVAVGSKIVAQNRAEQGKFSYFLFAAKE